MFSLMFVALVSCCNKQKNTDIQLLDAEKFKTTVEDKNVELYTLESGAGLSMQVTNYGGRIVSLWVPDKDGKHEDVVFGFDNIADYIANKGGERYLGPVIGRCGNRIANAQFVLNGVTYKLPANDNKVNCLHGGLKGFDSHAWTVDSVTTNFIALSYISPDGDEGFPGTVNVKMTYELTTANELIIKYEATTDKPTHINLTNHSQFNLKGGGNGEILDHYLTIYANQITPVDSLLIPTGEFMDVKDTPFDFNVPTLVGERIVADNEQIKLGNGYDHNWIVTQTDTTINHVATVYEPASGRVMDVYSDQPGVQIYTANFFTGKVIGKYGKPLLHRGAIALETQKFPNTPNQPNFPTTLVKPDEVYTQTCIYKFSVK
jgi:aldose 1-epimerase